jgi:hypothetical protein
MIVTLVAVAVAAAAGFGVGRIKNATTLAALKAEVTKIVTAGETDVKKVVADIEAEFKKL